MLADALFGEALMTQTQIAVSLSLCLLFTGVNPWRLTQKDRTANKQSTPQAAAADTAVRVMWQEPRDLESRDLFYGSGGPAGAPDPASRFKFIRRQGSPTDPSEKIIVEDERGRRWTVKFGPETRPETTAARIVWAAGYHTDQDYFVKRAHIDGRGGFDVWNVRFERRNDGFDDQGNWSWKQNPFDNTRDLQGLKVLMALVNNWDLSDANTKIVLDTNDSQGRLVYYISDLGASLGTTHSWLTRLPGNADAAGPGSRGDADAFARHPFIDGVRDGRVVFHWERKFALYVLDGVTVENAHWIGNLLGRLSDKQLADACRAGGFDDAEVATYVRALRDRIRQLQSLK